MPPNPNLINLTAQLLEHAAAPLVHLVEGGARDNLVFIIKLIAWKLIFKERLVRLQLVSLNFLQDVLLVFLWGFFG